MSAQPPDQNPEPTVSKIEQGLRALNVEFTCQQVEKLQQFIGLLQKWNNSFNLVADSSEDELISRHLLDSLSISEHISGSIVADIGSGAGFPGVPLAIFHPHTRFILLDSNGKKTRFLFQVKLALGLENLTVENCRIEHYQSFEQIDIVTCRAFSTLQDTVVLADSLLGESTRLLAMKGRFPQSEVDALPDGFRVTNSTALDIPGLPVERHLVEIGRTG